MPNYLKRAAKAENRMINSLEKADAKVSKKISKSSGMEYEPKVKPRHMGAMKPKKKK